MADCLQCRACYGVLRFIMESGAKGCEVIVSGKLRGQRAKSMKFVDGFRIHAGHPTIDYIDSAVTHVHLRQGKGCTEFCVFTIFVVCSSSAIYAPPQVC